MLRIIESFSRKPNMIEQSDDPDHDLRLVRATQQIRTHNSNRAPVIIFIVGSMYVAFLWNEAPRINLIIWSCLIFGAAILRSLVCKKIEPKIALAKHSELEKFERKLFLTSSLNSILIGSGFWWVCLQGSDTAVFAICLLCCMYSVATTIHSSVRFESFSVLVMMNLGQGILFMFVIDGGPFYAVIALFFGVLILLIGFGYENSKTFSDSIHIREENVGLVKQLNEEKRAVERALASAKRAHDSKNRFLAVASHDLRQPLYAITLSLDSLYLSVQGRSEQKIIKRVNESLNVLGKQFDDLLDLSKFDADSVEVRLSVFSVEKLLERLVENFRPEAQEKNLELKLKSSNCKVHTDALLVERVIMNLLSNAIRYTNEGFIVVQAVHEMNDVRISVKDTGAGISREHQSKIFDEYTQLITSDSVRTQGVGLGLSIVGRINQLLNLRLELHSEIGQGSEFIIFVPAK